MKTSIEIQNDISRINQVAYRNAAINAKAKIGPASFYSSALEAIRHYRHANSHNVPSIQAYCNLMGYSQIE
jgi:hypothetical protein